MEIIYQACSSPGRKPRPSGKSVDEAWTSKGCRRTAEGDVDDAVGRTDAALYPHGQWREKYSDEAEENVAPTHTELPKLYISCWMLGGFHRV